MHALTGAENGIGKVMSGMPVRRKKWIRVETLKNILKMLCLNINSDCIITKHWEIY